MVFQRSMALGTATHPRTVADRIELSVRVAGDLVLLADP